jgi:nicotinamide-nucleotide amidase
MPVADRVLALLAKRQQTLATAESLTGGLIGQLLTSVPGASAVYLGGVISYATRLKATLSGVSEATLARSGAVAADTAIEMAHGVAVQCQAVWGLATTGVAGPDGQDGHPVGQVFVAVSDRQSGYSRVEELNLTGSRTQIREAAAAEALTLLERALGMNLDGERVL